jgi:hypothetical protein
MEMPNIFKGQSESSKLLYATLLGSIAATLTPNPSDIIWWKYHKLNRDKWAKGEITSKEYWKQQAILQYIASSAYWITLLGIAYLVPGEYKKKLAVVLGVATIGTIGTIIYKHNKTDESENLAELNAIKQKLYESANDDDLQRAKKLI